RPAHRELLARGSHQRGRPGEDRASERRAGVAVVRDGPRALRRPQRISEPLATLPARDMSEGKMPTSATGASPIDMNDMLSPAPFALTGVPRIGSLHVHLGAACLTRHPDGGVLAAIQAREIRAELPDLRFQPS